MTLSNISSEFSFEDEFNNSVESLNRMIAGKNKVILEQESKINNLNALVDQLLGQVQSYKVETRRLNCLASKSEKQRDEIKRENKIIKQKCRIFKAVVVKNIREKKKYGTMNLEWNSDILPDRERRNYSFIER